MNKYKSIYTIIAQRLIGFGIVTQQQCDSIARVGTRKEHYWKRHILDLCEFALETMRIQNIENNNAKMLCKTGIRIANETAPHTT